MPRPRPFYGWWIVGAGFGLEALVGALMFHAYGAYVVLLAYAVTFWMVVAFAVLHGAAWGIRGPLMSAMRADYFGAASFGPITGVSSMVVMLGMMGGPVIAGVVADRTGSYVAGFEIVAGFAALGSVFFFLATPPRPPRGELLSVPAS